MLRQKYDTIRFPWEKEDVAATALKPPSVTIKVVLLGDSEVGKTALFHWYLGQRVRCSDTNARGAERARLCKNLRQADC